MRSDPSRSPSQQPPTTAAEGCVHASPYRYRRRHRRLGLPLRRMYTPARPPHFEGGQTTTPPPPKTCCQGDGKLSIGGAKKRGCVRGESRDGKKKNNNNNKGPTTPEIRTNERNEIVRRVSPRAATVRTETREKHFLPRPRQLYIYSFYFHFFCVFRIRFSSYSSRENIAKNTHPKYIDIPTRVA